MLTAIILLVLYQVLKSNQKKIIDIGAQSIVIWNIWSFFIVEALSDVNLLTGQMVFACWGVFDVALLILIIRNIKTSPVCLRQIIKAKIQESATNISQLKWNYLILSITGIIVLLLALVTVPYNWDSMTYHLPRIAHWAQNRSVAHYASNDVRQLSSPVLAEFVNLQVYLCSGRRDILFNMLQAVSFLVDAWFIYAITKKIGANEKFATLSVFLFMTMPIAFGEALNTQVDLFAALWLFIFVYYYIDLFEENLIFANRETVSKVILMALCVSFGYLTKPSVNIGMVWLLIVLFVKCILKHNKWKELIKLAFTALPFVFLPLLPEWYRNYQTFSALSDASVGARQLIGTLRPDYLFVSIIKNFAHNLPNIYLYHSDEIVTKVVSAIAVGLGVDLNAPSISEDGLEYILRKAPVYGHDTATNPVILILAIICTIVCLFSGKIKSTGNRYSLYIMAMFIIFCGAVRWEPYVSRYMLPYLGLLCPLVGIQLQKMEQRHIGQILVPVSWFLCFMTLVSMILYHGGCMPEKGAERVTGYFVNDKGMIPEYTWVFETLKEDGCQTMGLKVSAINFEYPMWRLSKYTMSRIENVLVENASSKYEDLSYIPDCVIMDRSAVAENIVIHGQEYYIPEKFQDNERLAVLYKK